MVNKKNSAGFVKNQDTQQTFVQAWTNSTKKKKVNQVQEEHELENYFYEDQEDDEVLHKLLKV